QNRRQRPDEVGTWDSSCAGVKIASHANSERQAVKRRQEMIVRLIAVARDPGYQRDKIPVARYCVPLIYGRPEPDSRLRLPLVPASAIGKIASVAVVDRAVRRALLCACRSAESAPCPV